MEKKKLKGTNPGKKNNNVFPMFRVNQKKNADLQAAEIGGGPVPSYIITEQFAPQCGEERLSLGPF